jgi:DNA-binding FadR family transcriptional regulator
MSGFHISITTGSGTPIYRQIIEQVRLGVATGTLATGDAMPSVRSLAEQNLVNPNTERDLECLGAVAVDEQPISLEDALIAHVGRQGDKSFFAAQL